ncbi:MAG: PGPGW domain-containing protein [Acidobacteria bacterium]|nr:PGPGW domain-containing protein [Acidobacteriota bacterium]
MKRILVLITGWAFIVIGIIGLFLPVIQGVLCLMIGLIILSTEYHWARRRLDRIKARFPGVARVSHEAAEKAGVWLRRLRGQPEPPPT